MILNIVLYTFNLNYVVREFNIDYDIEYTPKLNYTNHTIEYLRNESINIVVKKKNLEEYSLFMCRSLSYLGKKE